MKVIQFPDADLAEQERAFVEYAALARKAQATLKIDDGIAAGKAFGRFVRLFCGRDLQ